MGEKPEPDIEAYERELQLLPEAGRTPSVRAGLLVQVICQRNPSLAGQALRKVLAEDAPAQLADAIRTDAALRLQLLRLLDSSKKWETLAMALGAWDRAKGILPEFPAEEQGPGTKASPRKRRIYRSTGDVVEEIGKRLERGESEPPPDWPESFRKPWQEHAAAIAPADRTPAGVKPGKGASDRAPRKEIAAEIRIRAAALYLWANGLPHSRTPAIRLLENIRKARKAEALEHEAWGAKLKKRTRAAKPRPKGSRGK